MTMGISNERNAGSFLGAIPSVFHKMHRSSIRWKTLFFWTQQRRHTSVHLSSFACTSCWWKILSRTWNHCKGWLN